MSTEPAATYQPLQGWEWRGLRAENSLSLIPPDPDHTYFVRINEDGTFTVGVDSDG